jgi:phosphohistidine phosphatase
MRLLVVRHGHADPADVDTERPLSRRGRQDVRTLALFLGTSGVSVEQAFHSGLKRAEETATILAESICRTHRADLMPDLGPEDPPEPMIERIGQWSEDTLIVGHLPYVHKLGAHLLGLSGGERFPIPFRPATAVCFAAQGDEWFVDWVIAPGLLPKTDLLL